MASFSASRSRVRGSGNEDTKVSTVNRLSHANNRRAKAPLSDLNQIRSAVRLLQKESKDQLNLEKESQATFEFLSSQIVALKKAFDTLAEVVMEEVDSLRTESSKRWKSVEKELLRNTQHVKDIQNEVSLAKRELELWASKEREWSKDNEVLKVSHAHNAEWMQKMQRDVMDVKDEVREMKRALEAMK